MKRLSRECGSLDVSQAYWLPQPVAGTVCWRCKESVRVNVNQTKVVNCYNNAEQYTFTQAGYKEFSAFPQWRDARPGPVHIETVACELQHTKHSPITADHPSICDILQSHCGEYEEYWDVTPCRLAELYQRFGRTRCLHLQDSTMKRRVTATCNDGIFFALGCRSFVPHL
jgi:hypothetical protein